MVRSVVVSLLVLAAVSGCAPRTRAKVAMTLGVVATFAGTVMVSNVAANPSDCGGDEAMGFDGIINAAGCVGDDAVRMIPGTMLVTTGAAALVTGIIAYALAPSERHERPTPVRFLRGERWTRLRDERNRGRSGR